MSDHTDARSPQRDAWPRADAPEPASEKTAPAVGDSVPSEHDRREEAAAAWASTGAGVGDTGRGNGVRVAIALLVLVLAIRYLGIYGLLIIGALLVSIELHEFGHYWVAKRSGMKVTEFFMGFGPRIFSFRRGETEYGLKAIPAGGYVKIIGMNAFEEVDPADEARTYRRQGALKRMATVLAGPFMNLLIAFVLFTIMFTAIGRVSDAWTIKAVEPGSGAQLAGLESGDQLVAIDGTSIGAWSDFAAMLSEKAGKTVTFDVVHNGVHEQRQVSLGWRLNAAAIASIPSTPALSSSDVVRSADGAPLTSYADLRALLAEPGAPVTLRIARSAADPNGSLDAPPVTYAYDLAVQRPFTGLPEVGATGFLGVRPQTQVESLGPIGAVGESLRAMGTSVTQTGSAFGHLLTPSGLGDYAGQFADATKTTPTTTTTATQTGVLKPVGDSPAPETLKGTVSETRPISILGIVFLGSEAAQMGPWVFISLVAAVNLALGLINLLPMLPLDGGHMVIAAYEGIRGKIRGAPYQADITKLMPIVYAFMAVLILFGSSAMLLDWMSRPTLR